MSSLPLLWLSFYRETYQAVTDFGFYRRLLDRGAGAAVLYLVWLSIHVAVVLTLTVVWRFGDDFANFSAWARENFPVMEVSGGELVIRGEQPLVKYYRAERRWTFVFDTTGKVSDPSRLEQPAFLFTKRNLYFRYEGETQVYRWRDFAPFRIDRRELQALETFIRWAYFPVGYAMFLGYTLIAKAATAAFLTAFAQLAAVRYGVRLRFGQAFLVALYAMTPAILIDLAVGFTGLVISYFYAIYLTIACIYLYMATQKCLAPE